MEFEITPGWLQWCQNPTKPKFHLPEGAVDTHCHVFGPSNSFPYSPTRKYTPCDATKNQLFQLRDYLGFDKNVIVQASCYGTDNRALMDALSHSGNKARGIASVNNQVQDKELEEMHAAGIRGVRFNFLKRLVTITPKNVLIEIASRVAAFGWHVEVYFESADLPELWDFFTGLPTNVVVDHMGRPNVALGVNSPEFQLFTRLLNEHENIYTKVSCPERLSITGPKALNGEENAYQDVVPFARHLVENFSDRVLTGTDWPHPNLKKYMPDDGLLVDWIPHIATTPELQIKLLVDNPTRLYWT